MAQLISLVMVIFSLTPAFAPLVGEQIMAVSGWRGIFLAFVLFGIVLLTWYSARLGETLPPEKRRVFQRSRILPLCGKCMPTDKSGWPFLRNRCPT